MIARPATLLAALVVAGPVLAHTWRADPGDIPNGAPPPAAGAAVLKQCHRDVRIARSPICTNAERAGSGQLGRPLPPLPPEWYYPGQRRPRGT